MSGVPHVELGSGSERFEARVDGDTWPGDVGPQGGQHAWVALRTSGLGPVVTVRWETGPLDGGAYHPWNQRTVCLERGEEDGTQQAVGLAAQLGAGPPRCVPEICPGGPFRLRVKVMDEQGRVAEDRRMVASVALPLTDPCGADAGPIPDGGDALCRSIAESRGGDAGPF